MEETIYKKLALVQQGIKVPKTQYNKHGNYSYRSCEDILENVKPLLDEHGLVLILTDEPYEISGWHYIQAKAVITDTATGESVCAFAYAREQESQKGMSAAQISGSTSSYARKYVLSGLLCIDDTKDDDSYDQQNQDDRYRPLFNTDALANAKAILASQCREFARNTGLDPDTIMSGIKNREDYEQGKNDPDWFLMVAEEFGWKEN